MTQHHFDIGIAKEFGVDVAIFLDNIGFWIRRNQANKKHFHDGRYWTYNTIESFTYLFPYWTYKQMRVVLKHVEQSGLILTGNYNQIGYDRTTWYALTDKGHKLLNLPICPFGQMEMPEAPNPSAHLGTAIPYTIPDTKPDKIKIFSASDEAHNKNCTNDFGNDFEQKSRPTLFDEQDSSTIDQIYMDRDNKCTNNNADSGIYWKNGVYSQSKIPTNVQNLENTGQNLKLPLSESETNTEQSILPKSKKKKRVSPNEGLIHFDEFWKAYPRKEQRVKAEAAWKKHRLDLLAPEIVEKLNLRMKLQWQKKIEEQGKQYIPLPASYLNGKLWTDEIEIVKELREQKSIAKNNNFNPRNEVRCNVPEYGPGHPTWEMKYGKRTETHAN